MSLAQCRQGVKLAGQKVQAEAGAGVGGTMEDRTSSQSLAVEPGNIVTATSCYASLSFELLHHLLCSFASASIEL